MAQDAEHSKKLDEIKERQHTYLARRLEEHDVDKDDGLIPPEAKEDCVDHNPEFSADYVCHECSPSTDGFRILNTSTGGQDAPAAMSNGGERPPVR